MSAQLVGVSLETQSSTPLLAVGTIHTDEKGRQYQYCQYNTTTTAGQWSDITTDGTFDATPTTTSRCGTPGTHWKNLGVACCDGTNNYYGWFWIGFGEFECIIENSFGATDVLFTTANAGIPGSDSSSFQIDGVKTIDAGVTATRVTVYAAGRLTAGVAEAAD